MRLVKFRGVMQAIGKSSIVAVLRSIGRDRSHRGLLFPSSFNPQVQAFCVSNTIILPAGLRNRLPSETRVAVCLILGPVFVLWQESVERHRNLTPDEA
jgi:hypothetical protein